MQPPISSVEFRNFKGFRHYSIPLRGTNFLVGANNSGKSTLISSFRILEAALRRARSRKPERFLVGTEAMQGYEVNILDLDVSTENVHTDYDDVESSITFRFSNGNTLRLVFPRNGGCYLIPNVNGAVVGSPITFDKHFPISLIVVPVLGPLEHDEALVKSATIQRSVSSSRASRHLRSYWAYNREGFDSFAELVRETWPGMSLQRPEIFGDVVQMYCLENRMTRELYWAGFGFQIWCQLLSHLSRAEEGSLVVIDEPEVYLHPDVQRQLPLILERKHLQSVIATHSTEIISQADPSEIVPIDKKARSAKRLKEVAEIQLVLESIGSVQNLLLSRLARHGRVLFFEGDDLKLLRRFAARLDLVVMPNADVSLVKAGGFQGWKRIRDLSWGLKKLNLKMKIGAIFDRDYFPKAELEEIKRSLDDEVEFSAILHQKEIENYLLQPIALTRAMVSQLKRINSPLQIDLETVKAILLDITDDLHHETLGQYIVKELDWRKHEKTNPATITTEVSRSFALVWSDLSTRLSVAPGKEVLRRFRQRVQTDYAVNLSDTTITASMSASEIPEDLRRLLVGLVAFIEG